MPGVQHFDDLSGIQQAEVLAYDQVRQHDEEEFYSKLAGAGIPSIGKGKKPPRRPRRR